MRHVRRLLILLLIGLPSVIIAAGFLFVAALLGLLAWIMEGVSPATYVRLIWGNREESMVDDFRRAWATTGKGKL